MPDKIVVDVFKDMRELSRHLVTDEDEKYLTDTFLLSSEGIHANQWIFVLGALVPASQDINPEASVELRHQILTQSIYELFESVPVSTGTRLPPEYQRRNEAARESKARAYIVAQKFLRDFFSSIQKTICSGTAGGKELTIQGAGAGLAATIMMQLSVSQPFAIAITTAVLVIVMKSGKDAFCKMDFEQFWKQANADTPKLPSSPQILTAEEAKAIKPTRPRTPRK